MDWATFENSIDSYWHLAWTIIDVGLVVFILWKLREVSNDLKKGQQNERNN